MKFAYLVMAHHRFDVLELLLKDLDDERNDIFLHIDKKTSDIPYENLRKTVKKANLIFIRRIPVFWGSYSQIQCVLNLLRDAVSYGYHDYYHLLVGVEFPLKSQDYIHNFFEENKGKEFIGYANEKNYSYRLRYYRPWAKFERSKKNFEKLFYKLDVKLLRLQEKIGFSRLTREDDFYKKGYANWSITHELAKYVLGFEKQIKSTCRYTACADEVFLHTIVYHSDFYKNVYDINDEYHSVMRMTTWKDPHNQLHISDLPELCSSDMLFARKFDDTHATEIIEKLVATRVN